VATFLWHVGVCGTGHEHGKSVPLRLCPPSLTANLRPIELCGIGANIQERSPSLTPGQQAIVLYIAADTAQRVAKGATSVRLQRMRRHGLEEARGARQDAAGRRQVDVEGHGCSICAMSGIIYLVRHGEVFNPQQIIYGRLPGFGLSDLGQEQVKAAAAALEPFAPFDVLYSSPLQRAQESAALLAKTIQLPVSIDERLAETDIGGFEGGGFDALPAPYVTESGVAGIESAASMRSRFMAWATDALQQDASIVVVSHRDPIGVALLEWQGLGLAELPAMDLPTASVHQIKLGVHDPVVTRCWPVAPRPK
jgi:broad specificity phosphatase PhoE